MNRRVKAILVLLAVLLVAGAVAAWNWPRLLLAYGAWSVHELLARLQQILPGRVPDPNAN